MRTKLLAILLLAGSSLFAETRVHIGVNIGTFRQPAPVRVYSAPPPVRAAVVPMAPGHGFVWISGYWYPTGRSYAWRPGYWVRPPHAKAHWVAPRYKHGRYYGGYWRR